MNNLVSKSPVLRFKLGKKIEKFLVGGQPWAGYYTVGNWPRNEVTPRRKSSGTSAATVLGAYNRKVAANPELLNQSMNLVSPQFVPAWQLQGVNNQIPLDGSYYEKTVNGKVVERGRWLNGKQVPLSVNETIDGGNLPEVVVVGLDKSKQAPKTNTTVLQLKSSSAVSTSKSGISFKNAFNLARNSKLLEFVWNGKKYNTMKKGETKELWLASLNPLNLLTIVTPIITPVVLSSEISTTDFKPQIQNVRNNSYNRADIRSLINQAGFNAYNFSGALRKALRRYLNGESNDITLLDGTDLARFTLPYRRQGGLISRNPILRFKLKNK